MTTWKPWESKFDKTSLLDDISTHTSTASMRIVYSWTNWNHWICDTLAVTKHRQTYACRHQLNLLNYIEKVSQICLPIVQFQIIWQWRIFLRVRHLIVLRFFCVRYRIFCEVAVVEFLHVVGRCGKREKWNVWFWCRRKCVVIAWNHFTLNEECTHFQTRHNPKQHMATAHFSAMLVSLLRIKRSERCIKYWIRYKGHKS